MAQQYQKVTVTGSGPLGTALSLVVDFSPDATGPQRMGERWYRCQLCGFSYPRSKVVIKGGAAYGIPCKDYEDLSRRPLSS
jgi:rubredoxin